ncbi:hypothetical protein D3C73_1224880 [compost metagenome]
MHRRAHGEVSALVMIERCKGVFALREPPFLMLIALMIGDRCEFLRDDQPMIAQAHRHLRQAMHAATVKPLAPEQTGNR